MKNGLTAIAAAISILALPATASATHSNGAGPNEDKVDATGGFQVNIQSNTFDATGHVNARSDLTTVMGQWWLKVDTPSGALDARGHVECLTSNGNTAEWIGNVDQSTIPTAPVGSDIVAREVDNGEGANSPPDLHQAFFVNVPPVPPGQCPPFFFAVMPILQGNVVVHDGI